MANYPTFTIAPRMAAHNFSTGDGTTSQNIITGGDNGTRVYTLDFFSKVATAAIAAVEITNGTATYRVAAVTTNGNANVTESLIGGMDLPADAHSNPYITLPDNTWSLAVGLNAAVATTNDVSVIAYGADY